MPAQIGGALADIEAVHADLGRAQTASAAHSGQVAQEVLTALGEVQDVATVLRSAFEGRAQDLMAQISQASSTLRGADWAGNSRVAADAAEAQLSADVSTTVDAARVGIEQLTAALGNQVEAFHAEVTGQFANVMGNIEAAYQELARGTSMFAENLARADETITFGG